jgi:5'-3' exonuclease
LDAAGVVGKFGCRRSRFPNYPALVGDAADGYPGLPGWGAKSSAAVLATFVHLESIPPDWREWHVKCRHASALARMLANERDDALLFRTLATLRTDIALFGDVDELRWQGPRPGFDALVTRLDAAHTGSRQQRGHRPGRHPGSLRKSNRIGSWPVHSPLEVEFAVEIRPATGCCGGPHL